MAQEKIPRWKELLRGATVLITLGGTAATAFGCAPALAERPSSPATAPANPGETLNPTATQGAGETLNPSASESTTATSEPSQSEAIPSPSPAQSEVITSPSTTAEAEPIRDWQIPDDMEQVMAQWDTIDQVDRAKYVYQFIDLNGGTYTPEGPEWTPADSALRAVNGLNVISDYINDETNPDNKEVALKLLDGMIGDDPDYDTRTSLANYFSATADTLSNKNCPTAECAAYRRNAFLPEPNGILNASPNFTLTQDANGIAHRTSVVTVQLKDNTKGVDEMFPDGIKGQEQLVATAKLDTIAGDHRPLIRMFVFGTNHNVVYVNGQSSIPVSSLPGVINFTKS